MPVMKIKLVIILSLYSLTLTLATKLFLYRSFNKEVIVTLIPECVASSHNSFSLYQNFKIVPDCPLC